MDGPLYTIWKGKSDLSKLLRKKMIQLISWN